MRTRRIGTAVVAAGLTAACALVGPLADPDMSGAPRQACARIGPAAEADAPQCFSLQRGEERPDLTAGPLRIAAGQELVAVPSGAPGCAGHFSHFVVTGDSPAAGAMQVSVHDALARGEARRDFRWSRPVSGRSWTLAGVGDPLLNPATVRLRVDEGEVRVESLCLKSY